MQSQVMCETYKYNKEPTETNNRKACNEVIIENLNQNLTKANKRQMCSKARHSVHFFWKLGMLTKMQNVQFTQCTLEREHQRIVDRVFNVYFACNKNCQQYR